jgi:TPR repeat protein
VSGRDTPPADSSPRSAETISFGCRLCNWLCERFCPEGVAAREAFWEASHDWERGCSNEYELWSNDDGPGRALAEQALELQQSDRPAALALYRQAAAAGSVWAMETVAWYYETGCGVAADFAEAARYYRQAISAGSWLATIRYASLLERHHRDDEWTGVLEDGVRANFIPAYFWLAWYRYKRAPTRATCRDIRPLLEAAARSGHPAARLTLARFMLAGKYGLREMPAGLKALRAIAREYAPGRESEAETEPAEKLAA